jgi:hypothetical protein
MWAERQEKKETDMTKLIVIFLKLLIADVPKNL